MKWIELDFRRFLQIFVDFHEFFVGALKLAENREKDFFTFFAFLPPYIGVSGSPMFLKR